MQSSYFMALTLTPASLVNFLVFKISKITSQDTQRLNIVYLNTNSVRGCKKR